MTYDAELVDRVDALREDACGHLSRFAAALTEIVPEEAEVIARSYERAVAVIVALADLCGACVMTRPGSV